MSDLAMIVMLAIATYGTRVSGYLILSRFHHLNPRIEAALDAVPAAVITAIVAPMVLVTGIAETGAAAATVVASLKLPIHGALAVGVATVVALRLLGA